MVVFCLFKYYAIRINKMGCIFVDHDVIFDFVLHMKVQAKFDSNIYNLNCRIQLYYRIKRLIKSWA